MDSGSRKCSIASFLSAFLGVLSVSLALLLPGLVDTKLREGIEDAVLLSRRAMQDQTDLWKSWKDNRENPGTPLHFKLWFFNLTNPEAMVRGEKPEIQEIGPYSYREMIFRFNTSFQRDLHGEEVLQYHEWKYFVFDPRDSPPGLSESDPITTVNLAFQALRGTFYDLPLGQEILSEVLYPDTEGWDDRTRLLRTQTVRDWLWGYPDPVLGKLNQTFPGVLRNMSDLQEAEQSGWNQIYTGERGNLGKARELRIRFGSPDILTPSSLLNRSEISETWGSREANRVRGTEGTNFRPHLRAGGTLTAYVPDLFRSVVLSQESRETFREKGIRLHKYRIGKEVFQSAAENPGNAVYFQERRGLFNLTRAKSGTPIFVSQPHFLGADAEHRDKLVGMTAPDPGLHEVFLGIEPNTGIVMVARKRMQINCLIQPLEIRTSNGTQTWFPNIPQETFFPIFWAEEGGTIPSDKAQEFKSKVYFAQNLSYYVFWVCGIGGLLLVILGWGLLWRVVRRSQRERSAAAKHESLASGAEDGKQGKQGSGGWEDGEEYTVLLDEDHELSKQHLLQ